jgi:hypothetical protein
MERVQNSGSTTYVTVILQEFVPRRLWQHLLHNQHALLIKGALLFKPNIVVTSVPFHLGPSFNILGFGRRTGQHRDGKRLKKGRDWCG